MASRLSGLTGICALTALLATADARAGIRPFIWTWDTQIVPQGDVELEQWLWVRGQPLESPNPDPSAPHPLADYWIWWGPVFGLTDRLEIALPFQALGRSSPMAFWLESFEVDARYRLFSRNDDGKLQPLIRAAFHQAVRSPGTYSRLDANAVLSYGALSELHVTADLGTRIFLPFLSWSPAPPRVQLTYAAGASYPFTQEFHGAVEIFGELDVANAPNANDRQHHFAGASFGYQKGRFWITAGVLVGLTPLVPTTPKFMPRLIWAVAL